MGKTEQYLDRIRSEIAPSDVTLKAVRDRREAVLALAMGFGGELDVFRSGSVAHGTANSDTDGDGGIVLDRRSHSSLGPDGDGEGPGLVVEQVRAHVRDGIKDSYPSATFRLTKRAIKIKFNEPLDDETDPTVDLIVALERRDAPGLWIPNLGSETWDASHPKEHTKMLLAPPAEPRQTRARVIRLAKAWNTQYDPVLMCSFNIEALALAAITDKSPLGEGLLTFFEHATSDLARRPTPDPAGVSKPIRVEDRERAVARLAEARDLVRNALDNDNDDGIVAAAMGDLFPDYIDPPTGAASKASMAAALAGGTSAVKVSKGQLTPSGGGRSLKDTRAFGGDVHR